MYSSFSDVPSKVVQYESAKAAFYGFRDLGFAVPDGTEFTARINELGVVLLAWNAAAASGRFRRGVYLIDSAISSSDRFDRELVVGAEVLAEQCIQSIISSYAVNRLGFADPMASAA